MLSGNKETHLFGQSDKEDYRGIKGSHKVNANSNSAPSLTCIMCVCWCRWHIFVHVLSGICAITELSETRSMLQFLESRPATLSSRSITYSLYLSRLYAVKIYSQVILLRHYIAIPSPYFIPFFDTKSRFHGDIKIANISSAYNSFVICRIRAELNVSYIIIFQISDKIFTFFSSFGVPFLDL